MNPEPTIHEETPRSSSEIESDIRDTRNRMDTTLDELGNKFTARSLLNSALDWWESPAKGNQGTVATRNACKSTLRQISRHPMPSLLIGSGIAWLVSERTGREDDHYPGAYRSHPYPKGNGSNAAGNGSHDDEGMFEKISDATHQAGQAIGEAGKRVSAFGEKVHGRADHLGHEAYDRGKSLVNTIRHEVSDTCHMGAQRFDRAVGDYPLAVGVAFAALGALIGLALPHTRREDKWMGETSDEVAETAREKGKEIVESGKQVGSRVMEAVQEEAHEQGLTAEKAGEAMSGLAEKGGKVLEKARDEAVTAANEEGLLPAGTNA